MRAPSGQRHEIALGDQQVSVAEVGAGLRTYSVGEREVVDGYGPEEMCTSGRGQVLVPWPNRIQDGRYEFRDVQHQLPLTEPTRSNAIHGLVRWSAWSVVERESHRIVLAHDLHPQPGYPFALDLRIEYALSGNGLRVATTATNMGADECPYGCGAHPYLTVGTERVDTSRLRLPARTVLRSDERGIPVQASSVDGTGFDFRDARPIGETVLDHCFTDLERVEDGTARVELTNPDEGRRLTLWVDDAYRYLMLFTGDGLLDVARRSLAVEPMSCPPNAFRSGEGVMVLEPGTSVTATWGLSFPDVG